MLVSDGVRCAWPSQSLSKASVHRGEMVAELSHLDNWGSSRGAPTQVTVAGRDLNPRERVVASN
jgi:hypothetical protein